MSKSCWIALALVFCFAASAMAVEVTLKEEGLRLQIYGYVKADLTYDSQETEPKNDVTFTFFVLPEIEGEKDSQLRLGARETRLGLNLFGPAVGNWKTIGKIEMDFYGGGGSANSYTPRIRLAYVDAAHSSGLAIRAGQDWDTFVEIAPRIVNFAYLADVGALGLRRPQARATKEIKVAENTKLVLKVAAAQTVGQDLDGGGFDDGSDADAPTAQFNVALHQKLWCEKSARIAFSGHYGEETLDGVTKTVATNAAGVITETTKKSANDVADYDTWSAQGSVFLPLTKCLAVQANIWQGVNLDTYYGGIGQGVNSTLGEEIESVGGYAQLLWDPTAKISVGLGYSVDDPKDEDLSAGMRSKNEMYLVNVAYKFTPALTAMAEYSQMTTGYLEGKDVSNDRIQLAMKYTF